MSNINQYQFRGVASPNTTQVPDQYFDELMSICSGAEFKALMYIARRTLGFKRPSDNISLSQLLHGITTRDGRVLDRGTGLSKPTLLAALRSLAAMGVIVPERRRSREKGDEPTCYSLRFAEAAVPTAAPVVKKVIQGGGKETLPGGWTKNFTTQHTGEQQTGLQHTASSKFNTSNGKAKRSDAIVENVVSAGTPVPVRDDTDRPARSGRIEHLIREFSHDLKDAGHSESNCSQALRLLGASNLTEDAFEHRLFVARSVTRNELLRRPREGLSPVSRPMAYFFSVLRHDLDLASTQHDESRASFQGVSP